MKVRKGTLYIKMKKGRERNVGRDLPRRRRHRWIH